MSDEIRATGGEPPSGDGTGPDAASEPLGGGTPEAEPASGGEPRATDWVRQLQAMIDDVATQAGPVLRDVAARAAELAQKAAEAAAPYAQKAAEAAAPYAAKAADVTADVGERVAIKGREVAADLRRSSGGTAVTTTGDEGPEPTGESVGEPPTERTDAGAGPA